LSRTHSRARSPHVSSGPCGEVPTSSALHDGLGNQARVAGAGLCRPTEEDYGFGGSFAAMMLDVLPLGEALATAIDFLDNSAVMGWLRRRDPREVLDACDGAFAALAGQVFPVGRGIEGKVAAGVELGAGLEGELEVGMMRMDGTTVHLETTLEADMGAKVAAGADVENAFGEPFVGAMAKAGVKVVVEDQASVDVELDSLALLTSLGMIKTSVALAAAVGMKAPEADAKALQGLMDSLVRDLELPDFSHEISVEVKAQGGAHGTWETEALLQNFGAGLLFSRLPAAGIACPHIAAVAQLGCASKLNLFCRPGELGVGFELAVSALGSAMAGLSFWSAEEQAIDTVGVAIGLGKDTRLAIEKPLLVDGEDMEFGPAMVTLVDVAEGADRATSTGVRLPLADIGALVDRGPLAEVDWAVAGGDVSVGIDEEVDPAALPPSFVAELAHLREGLPESGMAMSDLEARMEGRVTVPASVFVALQADGLVKPPSTSTVVFMGQIARGLLAHKGGEALPDLLAPHGQGVAGCLGQIQTRKLKITGAARTGVGGRGTVALGVRAGGEAGGGLTRTFAREVHAGEAALALRAMGSGARLAG